MKSAATIPRVVATETSAQRARTPLITVSPHRLRGGARLSVAAGVAKLGRSGLERGLRLLRLIGSHWNEEGLLGQRLFVVQQVLDECLHLGLRQRRVLHV